jgi:hypothetical protein
MERWGRQGFYGFDGHKNIRYLADSSGNVIGTCDYDASGI